jgi:hypothetical protein
VAGVGVQGVPDHHERAAGLLVRGVQEPGVVRLGEALALICPPGVVRAVGQPGLAPGPDGDQRGQRHPGVMAACHFHDGSAAAARVVWPVCARPPVWLARLQDALASRYCSRSWAASSMSLCRHSAAR